MALAQPTSRVSRTVPPPPGKMPRATSPWLNTEFVAATRMSEARNNSCPAYLVPPWTATTTGLLR